MVATSTISSVGRMMLPTCTPAKDTLRVSSAVTSDSTQVVAWGKKVSSRVGSWLPKRNKNVIWKANSKAASSVRPSPSDREKASPGVRVSTYSPTKHRAAHRYTFFFGGWRISSQVTKGVSTT